MLELFVSHNEISIYPYVNFLEHQPTLPLDCTIECLCFYFSGMDDYTDDMFAFCQGMARTQVDNAEYALLTALCIFSGGPPKYFREQFQNLDLWDS